MKWIGLGLVGLSILLYAGLLVVPFLPWSLGMKAAISSVLVILGEASFWGGGLILGREVVLRYRKALNPCRWFGRGEKKRHED